MNLSVVRGLMKGGMVELFGIILAVVVVVLLAFDSRNFGFVERRLRNHAVPN